MLAAAPMPVSDMRAADSWDRSPTWPLRPDGVGERRGWAGVMGELWGEDGVMGSGWLLPDGVSCSSDMGEELRASRVRGVTGLGVRVLRPLTAGVRGDAKGDGRREGGDVGVIWNGSESCVGVDCVDCVHAGVCARCAGVSAMS